MADLISSFPDLATAEPNDQGSVMGTMFSINHKQRPGLQFGIKQ